MIPAKFSSEIPSLGDLVQASNACIFVDRIKLLSMRYLSILLSCIAILLCLILVYNHDDVSEGKISTESEENQPEVIPEKVEVVAVMGRLQVYANKLYFAGKEENKALYQFYLNELREGMAEVAAGKVTMDGVDLSMNMDAFGLQSLKVLEKRIGQEGFKNFDEHYLNVITACNSCHKVSKKGFVNITVPKTPLFDNQVYTKGEFSDMVVDTDGD